MIDLGNRFELVECKWSESPTPTDTASIQKVATLLGRERPVGMRVACRTPHPFAMPHSVTAVNGFQERDWIAPSTPKASTSPQRI